MVSRIIPGMWSDCRLGIIHLVRVPFLWCNWIADYVLLGVNHGVLSFLLSGKSILYDGPGPLCSVLHGKLTSSFQLVISTKSLDDGYNSYFEFQVVSAPASVSHQIEVWNTSSKISTLNQLSLTSVTLVIDWVEWTGWRGMTCEYGGLSLLLPQHSDNLLEIGPYCGQYKSMIDVPQVKTSYLHTRSYIVLYSYPTYFNLSVKYTLMFSDIHQITIPNFRLDWIYPYFIDLKDIKLSLDIITYGPARFRYNIFLHGLEVFQIFLLPLCIPSIHGECSQVSIPLISVDNTNIEYELEMQQSP